MNEIIRKQDQTIATLKKEINYLKKKMSEDFFEYSEQLEAKDLEISRLHGELDLARITLKSNNLSVDLDKDLDQIVKENEPRLPAIFEHDMEKIRSLHNKIKNRPSLCYVRINWPIEVIHPTKGDWYDKTYYFDEESRLCGPIGDKKYIEIIAKRLNVENEGDCEPWDEEDSVKRKILDGELEEIHQKIEENRKPKTTQIQQDLISSLKGTLGQNQYDDIIREQLALISLMLRNLK